MSCIFFYQPSISYEEIEKHVERNALSHFLQYRNCFDCSYLADVRNRKTNEEITMPCVRPNGPRPKLPLQSDTAIVANRSQGIWCIDLLTHDLTLCSESAELFGGESGSGDGFIRFLEFFRKGRDRSLVARYIRESINQNKPWSVTLSLPSKRLGKRKKIVLTGRSEVESGVCVRVAGTVTEREAGVNDVCGISDYYQSDMSGKKREDQGLEVVRVLLVDDNPLNTFLARNVMRQLNVFVSVVEARNGREAVDLFVDGHFDLILMDVQMPFMNGYEATMKIRELSTDKNLPIIALSGITEQDEPDRCIAAGMNDFVIKPIVKASMEDVIAKWVRRKPGSLQHFDLRSLAARLNNNALLARQMLKLALSDIEQCLVSIEKTDLCNRDRVQYFATRISDTSRNVYFDQLGEFTEKLLADIHGPAEQLSKYIAFIRTEFEIISGLAGNQSGTL